MKRGGVGLYIKDSLPSKNRTDLVTLPECILYEIQLNRKKYFYAVIYRSPRQGPEEFDNFTINFELMLSKCMPKILSVLSLLVISTVDQLSGGKMISKITKEKYSSQ